VGDQNDSLQLVHIHKKVELIGSGFALFPGIRVSCHTRRATGNGEPVVARKLQTNLKKLIAGGAQPPVTAVHGRSTRAGVIEWSL